LQSNKRAKLRVFAVILLSVFVFISLGLVFDEAEAKKSSGTYLTEIGSKKICGDKLCSVPLSIEEKIAAFLAKTKLDASTTEPELPEKFTPSVLQQAKPEKCSPWPTCRDGGGEKGGGKGGGTGTVTNPAPKPQCECYYNKDCFFLNVCTDFGKCIVNKGGPNGKIQDGMCRFFLFTLLDKGDNRNLSAKAVDNYLLAFETSAMEGISEPNENYLTAALDLKLPYEGHLAIQNIVNNVMIATVGPTEYEIEVPHRLGYYNLPDPIEYNFEIKKKNNLPTPEFGTLEQMDDPTIQALSITRNAIVAEIQEPNNGIFENQMNSLREIEGYGAFGRCEYPHPEEHGHVFPYEDGIDCLISEMGRMIHKFNDIGAPEPTTGRIVPSLLIEGNFYPIFQFLWSDPDNCKERHIHAIQGYTTEGKLVSFTDTDPNACGVVAESELEEKLHDIQMTESQISTLEELTEKKIP